MINTAANDNRQPAANDNSRRWSIYTLSDSRSSDVPRYVGLTNNPRRRLYLHKWGSLNLSDKTHRGNWMRSVIRNGADVLMKIVIDDLPSFEEAASKEIELISTMRMAGANLVNSTSGGDGLRDPSDCTRAKISAVHKGKKLKPETIAKMRTANTGKKLSNETRSKIRAANIGKMRTPESIEATRKFWTGRTHSTEARAKMSKSQKGRVTTVATRLKLSAALKGRILSADAVTNMNEARNRPDVKQRMASAIAALPSRNGGFKGVSAAAGKFQATIRVKGVRRHLGSFETAEDAARAYDAEARAAWGDDAYINFPERLSEAPPIPFRYANPFRGVTRDAGKWKAQITIDGKRKFLGFHDSAPDAARAYDRVAAAARGHKAKLNFPTADNEADKANAA